ncbi:hypothetical protein J6590_075066 [Homalodisca vitripennis]|nr:hypothetical protein J6590_075066 [Homalodisca vitripennis]
MPMVIIVRPLEPKYECCTLVVHLHTNYDKETADLSSKRNDDRISWMGKIEDGAASCRYPRGKILGINLSHVSLEVGEAISEPASPVKTGRGGTPTYRSILAPQYLDICATPGHQLGVSMAEWSKSLDFESELEIAQVQILSVTVALVISTINLVLYRLSPLFCLIRSSHRPVAHEDGQNKV